MPGPDHSAFSSGDCTVTIITPTYNRSHLLPRALDSALQQTFRDFELLVIDDGSTDDTAAMMAHYEKRDARVRYLVQPENRGVSAARNRGFHEGRGRFFALLDSDDEWHPDKLRRQLEAFDQASRDLGLLYTAVETLGPEKWIEKPEFRGDPSKILLVRNVIHGTSSVMLRREAVERTGDFDEGIPAIEDWDYWIRLARSYHVDYLPDVLAYYHDAKDDFQRKSLIASENRAAREWLYQKHEKHMHDAGVAHVFLVESARRHLIPPKDPDGARQLLFCAIRVRPLQLRAYAKLARVTLKSWLQRSSPASAASSRAERSSG